MTTPSPIDSPDLRGLLKKHFLSAALSLLIIVVVAAVLTVRFRPQLDAVTQTVFEHIGIWGLLALIFVTDAFVSPFPPDTVLIIISASSYHEQWPWLLPLFGVASSAAGCLGYSCGRALSRRAWAQRYFGNFHQKSEALIGRYGPWGVALGAMTPIPFSITCWTAGLLRLPFRSFFFPCLLRVPRYVAYYAAIAYFPRLLG